MKISPKQIQLKNGKTVTLRSVTAIDAEDMIAHLIITHTESYQNMNQTAGFWRNLPIDKEKEILSDFDSSNSKFMIAATYENRIIGGLGFTVNQAQFQKSNGSLGMSIQKEFSNSGLGTKMMELAIKTAKEINLHRIELTVRTYNKAGIALYEKMGFERIGTLKEIAFIDNEYFDEYSYQLILKKTNNLFS